MKKKVLLTGSKGFILTAFYNRYEKKYKIIRTGRKDESLINLDVRDEEQVKKVIKQFKPDYVLHGAGITSTGGCENNKTLAYDVNVKGSINIAKACHENGAKMIFFSTEQVFNGNNNPGPYSEDMKAIPNTYYGVTKLKAENEIKKIINDLVIMRLTWMYDFSKDPRIKNILTDTILSKEDIKVPANEYRGMTPLEQLLDFFPQIMNLQRGTYHIGSENNKSRYEIVQLILDLTNRKNIKAIINNHQNVRDIRLDMNKINQLGIVFDSTEEAIKNSIDKYKSEIREII